MSKDRVERVENKSQILNNEQTEAKPVPCCTTGLGTKKPYVAPKLTHEGKWDTVTMQFGGSFSMP